jgi:hypothetical protein
VGGQTELLVTVQELIMSGEPIVLTATPSDASRTQLRAIVNNEAGQEVASALIDHEHQAKMRPLPPGGYTITVGGVGTATARVAPVTCPILVWGAGESE